MFVIVDLSDENIRLYSEYIDEDMAENIERSNYFGLVACDDFGKAKAGMMWQYKNVETDEDSESLIEWIRAENDEAFTQMMNAYQMRVLEKEVVRSKISIPVKDGKELKARLKDIGFDMKLTESDLIVVKLSELSNSAIIKKMRGKKVPSSIKALKELTPRAFRAGIAKCVIKGRKGLCEDLGDLYIQWFETDVSCASVDEKGVNGFFLFHKKPSGLITVQLMICLGSNFKSVLPLMMYRFVSAMEEKYGPDQKVAFDRHNEQVLMLAEKLMPRGFGIPVYAGSRKEN